MFNGLYCACQFEYDAGDCNNKGFCSLNSSVILYSVKFMQDI